jgi:hypothetical protein
MPRRKSSKLPKEGCWLSPRRQVAFRLRVVSVRAQAMPADLWAECPRGSIAGSAGTSIAFFAVLRRPSCP